MCVIYNLQSHTGCGCIWSKDTLGGECNLQAELCRYQSKGIVKDRERSSPDLENSRVKMSPSANTCWGFSPKLTVCILSLSGIVMVTKLDVHACTITVSGPSRSESSTIIRSTLTVSILAANFTSAWKSVIFSLGSTSHTQWTGHCLT